MGSDDDAKIENEKEEKIGNNKRQKKERKKNSKSCESRYSCILLRVTRERKLIFYDIISTNEAFQFSPFSKILECFVNFLSLPHLITIHF